MVLAETTCDGKKKMYELMRELKHCHIMQLPPGKTGRGALDFWKQEVISVKEDLEQFYNIEITDDKLRSAIRLRNRERKAVLDFLRLQDSSLPQSLDTKSVPSSPPMSFPLTWKRRSLSLKNVPPN